MYQEKEYVINVLKLYIHLPLIIYYYFAQPTDDDDDYDYIYIHHVRDDSKQASMLYIFPFYSLKQAKGNINFYGDNLIPCFTQLT